MHMYKGCGCQADTWDFTRQHGNKFNIRTLLRRAPQLAVSWTWWAVQRFWTCVSIPRGLLHPLELWSTWPPRGAGDTAGSQEHSLRLSSGWGHGSRSSLGHFQMAWGFETAVCLHFRLIFREWFLPARALGWESGFQLRSPAPARTAGSSWGREGLVLFTKLHTCENWELKEKR